jgi:hypothetical protein
MPSLMHRGRVLGDRTTYVGLDVTGTGSSWRSRKAACGARFETTAVSRTRRRLCTNNPAIRSARSCGRAAPRPTCQSAALATAPATLACRASPGTPLPVRGIEVNWRAGLASDPIDVNDDDQVTWLEALIWPGEPDRLANFRASLAIARRDPPRIIRGDLRADRSGSRQRLRATRRWSSFTLRCWPTLKARRIGPPLPAQCANLAPCGSVMKHQGWFRKLAPR